MEVAKAIILNMKTGAAAAPEDTSLHSDLMRDPCYWVMSKWTFTDMSKKSKDGLRDTARAARRDREAKKYAIPRRTPQYKWHRCTYIINIKVLMIMSKKLEG